MLRKINMHDRKLAFRFYHLGAPSHQTRQPAHSLAALCNLLGKIIAELDMYRRLDVASTQLFDCSSPSQLSQFSAPPTNTTSTVPSSLRSP